MDEPLPVVAAVPVAPLKHSWLRRPTERTLLVASALLALVVTSVWVLANMSFIRFALEAQGASFSVVEQGESVSYDVSLGSISKRTTVKGYERAPVQVLEVSQYNGNSGDVAVLAHVGGTDGTVLGVIHPNGTFTSVLSDGTRKADLVVRPDGIGLFSALVDGESHIMQINVAVPNNSLKDLGRGRSPRLFADGFFVALTPVGVVRIDPALSGVDILVLRSDADRMSSSLSPSGVRVVLPNTSGKTDFLSLRSLSPVQLALESTAPQVYGGPAVWVSAHFFVVPSGSGRFDLYSLYGDAPVRVATMSSVN